MAVSAKSNKKPKVVVQEVDPDQSDETESESGEELGDDMVEIKEEVEDVGEYVSDTSGLDGDITEIKSEDEEDESAMDVKEEDSDSEISSGDVSEDSDVNLDDDSEDERKKLKLKKKEEKRVQIMAESSDSSDTESDPDPDDEDEDEDDDDDDDKPEVKNEPDTEESRKGLANVMAHILATPGGSNLILAKAKKDRMVKKVENIGEFEFVDAEGNVKNDMKIEVKDEEDERAKIWKKEQEKNAVIGKLKLKPAIETDKVKERNLRRIATRGVVQLFTAIEKHKSAVRKERIGTKSIVAREQMSAGRMKSSFLDILEKEGEKLTKLEKPKSIKRESKPTIALPTAGSKKPKWNVFADNFYKEPTLTGWDLKSDEED